MDEKIREYIWLYADKPTVEIKAGLLRNFGLSPSFDEIVLEQRGYLAEAKYAAESEFLVDENAIKQAAQAFPSVTDDIVRKIVWFKLNTRYGCRRISKELNGEIGKDTVQKTYTKYQSLAKSRILKAKDKTSELKELEEKIDYLQEGFERLQQDNIFLRLKVEGGLIAKIIAHEMSRINLEVFQLFKQYCKKENLGTLAAIRKMGLTAFYYTNSFEDWYSLRAECKEFGMIALAWQITLDAHSFLLRQINKNQKQ